MRAVRDPDGSRPAPGPGPAEVVGGNGGDGNPAGKGALAIADADGNPIEPSIDGDVTVAPGENGAFLKSKVQEELESIFDSENTGTVVAPVYDEDGHLVSHEVTLAEDYGPVAFSNDFGAVTINLNGWSIEGPKGADGSGKIPGENGGAAITVDGACGAEAGETAITLKDERPDGVQLWENGPYFATCNVGATKPEESGYFFWWGDTVGYTNNGSAWISVKDGTTTIQFNDSDATAKQTYHRTIAQLYEDGYIDMNSVDGKLKPECDAARAHLKGDWRMPTYVEIEDLENKCNHEWTTTNGVDGYIVRGTGDYVSKAIFLPVTGVGVESVLEGVGEFSMYWSSSPFEDYSWGLASGDGGMFYDAFFDRCGGFPVRAVRDPDGSRPAPGPGPAEVVGGDGGDGNPEGKGAPAIAYADGTEITPTVIGEDINVTPGIDGKNLRDEAVKETFDEPEWVVTGPDLNGWYTAILTNDLTGPVEIPDDLGKVKIDLNGWNITGTNGVPGDAETAGGNGGNGLVIVHHDGDPRCEQSNYRLINEADDTDETRPAPGTGKHSEDVGDGVVAGGNGGAGHEPGDGAAGILVADDATPAAVTVGNNEDGSDNPVTVKGGNGGDGLGTDEETGNGIAGGNGGAGIEVDGTVQPDGVTVEDKGTVTGGNGGSGSDADPEADDATGGDGGNGGAGVNGNVTKNDGTITGGTGGDAGVGGEGGKGGKGVYGKGPDSGTGTKTDGENGSTGMLVPQSFMIIDHADAGNEKVHLAFQPVFGKAVDMAAWIQYARQNGVVHYVTADTEAELANAPLQDVTFRDGTGTQDVAKGWCWITVPGTNKLYKVVICGSPKEDGVQLWKDGPYFAICNVGAENPEDPGYYFWWGDTVGYKRNTDDNGWVSSQDGTTTIEFRSSDATAKQTYGQDATSLKDNGWIDESGNLVAAHDAARAHLKGDWRMPTSAEFKDLIDKCDHQWTTQNGVSGYIVRGKGDYASKGIFLPATGCGFGSAQLNSGSYGYYWSSSPSSESNYACSLDANQSSFVRDIYGYRYYGYSVRPVRDAK